MAGEAGVWTADRWSALVAAREVLSPAGDPLDDLSGPQLAGLMRLLDDVATRASALRVQVALEATRRGECDAGTHEWVREHAPSLRQGGSAAVARLVTEVVAGDSGVARVDPDPESGLGRVWSAVVDARIEPGTAVAVLRETARLEPLLQPEAVPTVATCLVDLAERWGPSTMRRLRPRLLADHGRDGVLDRLHERLAAAARLSSPRVESGDLTEYQLWMTPEQAAVLEAAIGPLAAPCPDAATGARDTRPAGRRRVEALTEVCRRSAGIDAATEAGAATTLHVTVPLSVLGGSGRGAGEVLGSVADGTALPPDVLRRLGCDAALVVHVLGTREEPLSLGRLLRLFTRSQRRHLWVRDRCCTFPGCTAPAAWTEAHHVRHWVDGGATDVWNAALLCRRHHGVVHRRRLWATVLAEPDDRGRYVVWNLSDGSYDRALENAPPAVASPLPQVRAGVPLRDPVDGCPSAWPVLDEESHPVTDTILEAAAA